MNFFYINILADLAMFNKDVGILKFFLLCWNVDIKGGTEKNTKMAKIKMRQSFHLKTFKA